MHLAAHPSPDGLSERRQRMDALATGNPLPPDVDVQAVDAGGVASEWTATPGADAGRVLVFLHGGGYITGSLTIHRHLVARAGREAAARTLAVDYRLAPEHPFPAALDDALAAYRFLLGGSLARAHSARRPGRWWRSGARHAGGFARRRGSYASGAWVSSPWVDLRMTGTTMVTKAAV